jgi:long-chain acyl-CoA synthetase
MDNPRDTVERLPVTSIPNLLYVSASRGPDRPALWRHDGHGFVSLNYGDLIETVAAISERLGRYQLADDARVAVWIKDRFQWSIAYLSVLWTGATVVPIDPLLTVGEIAGVLADAEVAAVVTDMTVEEVDATGVALTHIPLAEIWSASKHQADTTLPQPPEIDPQRLAELLYTSGTTGTAKGVMLTHANITSNIAGVTRMSLCSRDEILLSILPIHHAFESTTGFLYPLSIGAQVAFARSLKSNEFLADLRATRATLILAVPLFWEKVAAAIKRRIREAPVSRRMLFKVLSMIVRAGRALGQRSLGRVLFRPLRVRGGMDSLRMIVSGGAALPYDVAEFFETIGLPILQGYGLSEASPVVTVNRLGRHRIETVGPALPGVKIRLHQMRPDGTGEVAVAGPNVMQGYWRRSAESAAVLKDGWLMTGDIGVLDDDGHLRIVGRSKSVIVSGAGKNIYPEELEALLDHEPEIAESVVYALTRPGKIGETVAAVVVPDEEWFETVNRAAWGDDAAVRAAVGEAVARVCQRVAGYKRITQWELRSEPFERTSTRKIKRFLVTGGDRGLEPGR